jgi:putative endopeptidase
MRRRKTMNRKWFGLAVVVMAIFLVPRGARAQESAGTAEKPVVALSAAPEGGCTSLVFSPADGQDVIHGLDPGDMDTTANPCQDFYQFATGGWRAKNPIPAAYPSWGVGSKLANHNQEVLRGILENAAKNTAAPAGSTEQKIGDYYATCMNEEAIEAAGIAPLAPEMERIAKITSLRELQAESARMQSMGSGALFGFGSTQDFKDSSSVIGEAAQGGLGLPDRDYYTKDDDHSKELREKYVQHISKLLGLAGDSSDAAMAEAKTIMAIETSLAQASMTRVDRRNPDNTYHKMDRAGLKALTSNFNWDGYLTDIGYPNVQSVNVGQPEFFKAMDKQLAAVPLADWKTYLRWHLVHWAAPSLSAPFVEENFNFYGKTLTGTKEILPRWKRCVQSTDRQLGEALGQVYVKENFPPEAKARALDMVHHLVAALHADIQSLDWMSPATKTQAQGKLDAIQLKIGYPDKWRDYSTYQVDRVSYVGNLQRGRQFEFNRQLSQIGKPLDRTEWGMTPPTVNAYYNSSMNEIVFPAGILQPPFFDASAPDAVNYGAMGAVIGHEMTHGFDDEGSRFDAQGNLRDWWTAEDKKNFDERGDCIAKQFSSYTLEGGQHENGKLVEGESIADLGGLTIAYKALQAALAAHRQGSVGGFTPDQQFFLAWAHGWSSNERPEYVTMRLTVDPHAINRYRAIGPVSNMPEFQKAFGCKPDDSMMRPVADRCRIW